MRASCSMSGMCKRAFRTMRDSHVSDHSTQMQIRLKIKIQVIEFRSQHLLFKQSYPTLN